MRDIQFTKPNFGESPAKFFIEVRDELKKVTWPTKPAVIKMTAIVIGVTVGVSAYLGGLDFIFAKIFEIILQR
ncbi:preprotein translocase subunit SecE [Candidatus Gottesmanbacteria bacterium RIFCSPHIGHO2_01_FULL_42_12]|uniref:Protein translocase subunit SecE n=1 Tax=Candidatus Gottesmanbacteria bacterium RIFCSPHIGHO2_01_FULL_42_12 TaxID=1798377 RepID=A0A1F5Z5U9_9BACT|nr:MAG: preprotein translocase subunit SecE [Candidatus Gottesmanbacteria bacterium RIFCSPHIGHO2_01_FULL_42_12]